MVGYLKLYFLPGADKKVYYDLSSYMYELPMYGTFSVHYAYTFRWLRTVFLQY